MDISVIQTYLGDPKPHPLKTSETSPNAKLISDLKLVEQNYRYNEKLINLINNITKALNNIQNVQFNDCIDTTLLISISKYIKNSVKCNLYLTSFDGNIYYSYSNILKEYVYLDKQEIFKSVKDPEHKNLLDELYASVCDYLNFTNPDDYINHYIHLYYNRTDVFYNNCGLWNYFPEYVPSLNENDVPYIINRLGTAKYLLLNNNPKILICDELFDLDADFFYNCMQFKVSEKFKNTFEKMISLLYQRVYKTCKNYNKPAYTIFYNIYNLEGLIYPHSLAAVYPEFRYKLEFEDNTIKLSEYIDSLTPTSSTWTPPNSIQPFRPIGIVDTKTLYTTVNGYNPQKLYNYLYSIVDSSSDICQIDNISIALAMSLMSHISKRKIVVVTCSQDNISHAKAFFKGIICAQEANNTAVIDIGYELKHLRRKKFREKLHKLYGTKEKVLFIDNIDKPVSNPSDNNISEVLSEHNMQIIIFQTSRIIDYIANNSYIHINMSDWEPPTEKYDLNSEDELWAKLYLSVYGLHLIFNSRKSNMQFSLAKEIPKEDTDAFDEISEKEIIEKITNDFLNRCFVSKSEAEERQELRKKCINQIKQENPGASDDLIISKLDKRLWYSTYYDDFLKYADVFLETQYSKKLISKYQITSKTLKKYLSKADNTFKYGKLNSKYTGHDAAYGFMLLALKDTWEIVEKELQNTNVNTDANIENKISQKLDYLIESLPNTIDFRPLSHFSSASLTHK